MVVEKPGFTALLAISCSMGDMTMFRRAPIWLNEMLVI